jgi:hypothetical protein
VSGRGGYVGESAGLGRRRGLGGSFGDSGGGGLGQCTGGGYTRDGVLCGRLLGMNAREASRLLSARGERQLVKSSRRNKAVINIEEDVRGQN